MRSRLAVLARRHLSAAPERDEIAELIAKDVKTYPVMLYMKGSPEAPQCGFSKRAVQVGPSLFSSLVFSESMMTPAAETRHDTRSSAREARGQAREGAGFAAISALENVILFQMPFC